ncbi:MobV family relaxase [Nitrincola schmidtii]|uniref:MobV family relaxase n=1 Tax=Nitrincola schmidtii TaxID=1730894 RepID=UPI00124F7123|nr:MobV family relaxase [Nitrincola schmidtii]
MATREQRQNQAQSENEEKARKRNSHVKKSKKNDNDNVKQTSKNSRKSGTGKAIMRTQKLKTFSQITGAGKHIQRLQHTPNADPERLHLNRQLKGTGDLTADVRNYLNQHIEVRHKNGKPKIRNNAVLCVEQVLTASNEYFQDDPNNERLRKWIDAQMQYIEKKWGDNAVSVVLHNDERSPHLHVHIVPIVNGKLNARALIGGKSDEMSLMQDEYADAMKPLGLTRGIKNSKAYHTTIKQFYGMLEHDEKIKMPEFKNSVKNILKTLINPQESFEKQAAALLKRVVYNEKQLTYLKRQINNDRHKSKIVDKKLEHADKQLEKAHSIVDRVKDQNNDLRAINRQLINEQAQISEQLALYKKYEEQIKQIEEQQRLQREQQLNKQLELEKQAMRQEYYRNNNNDRGLTR